MTIAQRQGWDSIYRVGETWTVEAVAEEVAGRILYLPAYPGLNKKQLAKIAEILAQEAGRD